MSPLRAVAIELRLLAAQASDQADRLDALADGDEGRSGDDACHNGHAWCGREAAPADQRYVFRSRFVDYCSLTCRSRGELARAAAVSRKSCPVDWCGRRHAPAGVSRFYPGAYADFCSGACQQAAGVHTASDGEVRT